MEEAGDAESMSATAATAILRREHRLILRLLDAATDIGRHLLRGEPVSPTTLGEVMSFLGSFTNCCHEAKEEELLFPLLRSRSGCPDAVLERMAEEHAYARALVQQMAEAADQYARGVDEAAWRWAEVIGRYAALLHSHVDRENEQVFRAADASLTAEEQQELAAAFEKLEAERLGAGQSFQAHMERILVSITAP